MAKKTDMKAARERKQKIIVAVGGVLLAGLMVIQGPKLLDAFGGGSGSETAAPAAATTPQATPATGAPSATATPTPNVVVVEAPKSAQAQLAGVVIVPEQPVQPGDGQLGSFNRFDSKDPFVQQVKEQVAAATQPAQAAQAQAPKPASSAGAKAGASGSTAGGSQPAVGADPAAPVVLPTLAMLRVNGKLVSLEAGKRFPSGDGAFMVKSLKRNSVGIAVADGEFAGGGVLTLRLGRQVTLVNTATGARYVVKLVFLGDEANVTRFSTK